MFASPGGQPAPDDIMGRDLDIERFWYRLSGASCLLNEPRRLGKSSLLVRMKAIATPPGWRFVHTSVQGVRSTDEFAAHVLSEISRQQSLPDRIRQSVRAFLNDAEATVGGAGASLTLRPAFMQSPLSALETALAGAAAHLAEDHVHLAIAWDEFPDAIVSIIDHEGAEHAAALLGVLRRLREQNPWQIRWLLTGSVGLHHALRRLSSSGEQYVTDLDTVPLGPLEPGWAQWLAGSLLLGAGCRFDGGTTVALADVTDGIPYLLHLLVARARDEQRVVLASSDVDALFTAAIGDLDSSHQSTHLLSRLGDYYGPDTAAAEWILDLLATGSATRDDVTAAAGALPVPLPTESVRGLLDLLARDHYLEKSNEGIHAWRYPALRRIWVQRRR